MWNLPLFPKYLVCLYCITGEANFHWEGVSELAEGLSWAAWQTDPFHRVRGSGGEGRPPQAATEPLGSV